MKKPWEVGPQLRKIEGQSEPTEKLENFSRNLSVLPKTFDAEQRTFDVIWTTGARVFRSGWFEDFHEELSLEDGDVRMERLNSGAPFLANHDARSLESVIGVVERAEIKDGQGTATVRLSERDGVDDIARDIENGILRNISVGYSIRKWEKVEENEGVPVYRAVDWEPFELSVVPAGADDGAKIRSMDSGEEKKIDDTVEKSSQNETHEPNLRSQDEIQTELETENKEGNEMDEKLKKEVRSEGLKEGMAEGQKLERKRIADIKDAVRKAKMDEDFAEKLINDGVEIDAARGMILDALAEKDEETATRSANVEVGEDLSTEHTRTGMRDAILARALPKKYEVTEHARDFAFLSLHEMARECCQRNNISVKGKSPEEIARRALSTSDFPLILEDTMNKSLRDGYETTQVTWSPFVREVTVRDFKQISRTNLGDAPELEKLPEHGAVREGALSEAAEKYQVETYAKKLKVTRKTIINDDLDMVARLPNRFGSRSREKESDIIWAIITDNAAMSDTFALFSSQHSNLAGVASALSVASLGEARKDMRLQKGLDGQRIRVNPRYVYVPAELETLAEQILVQNTQPEADSNTNPFKGSLQPIAEPRLSDHSATAWYVFADASELDMIELARLEGMSGPQLETRDLGGVQGLEIEAYHDFGAAPIDFRGFYKNAGV